MEQRASGTQTLSFTICASKAAQPFNLIPPVEQTRVAGELFKSSRQSALIIFRKSGHSATVTWLHGHCKISRSPFERIWSRRLDLVFRQSNLFVIHFDSLIAMAQDPAALFQVCQYFGYIRLGGALRHSGRSRDSRPILNEIPPRQDIRAMTVRHIKYGAKAEDVGIFASAFIDTVSRLLSESWFSTRARESNRMFSSWKYRSLQRHDDTKPCRS